MEERKEWAQEKAILLNKIKLLETNS